MTNLAPCPFSHKGYDEEDFKPPQVYDDCDINQVWFQGYCPVCTGAGPECKTPKEAVAAWNKRADDLQRRFF